MHKFLFCASKSQNFTQSQRNLRGRKTMRPWLLETLGTPPFLKKYQKGHSLANMTTTIIEKVNSEDIFYRKEREAYHIRKFNTYYNGLKKYVIAGQY